MNPLNLLALRNKNDELVGYIVKPLPEFTGKILLDDIKQCAYMHAVYQGDNCICIFPYDSDFLKSSKVIV